MSSIENKFQLLNLSLQFLAFTTSIRYLNLLPFYSFIKLLIFFVKQNLRVSKLTVLRNTCINSVLVFNELLIQFSLLCSMLFKALTEFLIQAMDFNSLTVDWLPQGQVTSLVFNSNVMDELVVFQFHRNLFLRLLLPHAVDLQVTLSPVSFSITQSLASCLVRLFLRNL